MKRILLILSLVFIVLPKKQLFAIDVKPADPTSKFKVEWPNMSKPWAPPIISEDGRPQYFQYVLEIMAIVLIVYVGFSLGKNEWIQIIVGGSICTLLGPVLFACIIILATHTNLPTIWYFWFYIPLFLFWYLVGFVLAKMSMGAKKK